jgi:acetyl esterase/lipase
MNLPLRLTFVIAFFVAPMIRAVEIPPEPAPIPLWPNRQLPPDLPQEKTEQRAKGDQPTHRWTTNVTVPTIQPYLPPAEKNTGAAIVICPGGAYAGLAIDLEGHHVARWLNSIGIAGIVLKYRMPHPELTDPNGIPWPLMDAQRALRMTRAHAEEWHLDPARVGIMGFSAGGHLASSAATHFKPADIASSDPLDHFSTRPDFAILVYPVITFQPPFAHIGSRNNLLGKSADSKLVDLYSNERQVTAQTPPTFLVHAEEDDGVKCENSFMFYTACRAAKVPVELRLFVHGKHGFGLGAEGTEPSAWPGQCAAWLTKLKFTTPKP